jgi:Mg-chelatase subunit ChlD
MDEKKSISYQTEKKYIIIAKFQNKDWVKKLEAISGKPFEPFKHMGIVYLVIDCSGSMTEGSKIDQARKGAIGFSEEARKKGYSVGLIQFASYAIHMLEPQAESASFTSTVENMRAGGSTNMADAILMAKDNLEGKAGERVICIVTDGMPDDKNAALDAASAAKRNGIDIMTIGTDDADNALLEKLSTRKDLSVKVSRGELEQGIVSMAGMLTEE